MRVNHLQTPAGLRDVLPEEYDRKMALRERIGRVFSGFGYRGVESPLLEYREVFDLDDTQMYKLFDRDGAALALRADMTPPIARMAATAYAGETGPLRFYYFGDAFRENRGYQGKQRQVTQAGVELLGATGPAADGEVLALAVESLRACGLTDFRIHVGHAEFFKGILEESGLAEDQGRALQETVARRDFVASEELVQTLPLTPEQQELLLALPRLVGDVEVLSQAAEMTRSHQALAALAQLRELNEILAAYGVAESVRFDLGLVNQLNYYTGILLRGYAYGSGYSLVDGGRYDNLGQRFGRPRPSVGFAIRLGGLLDALRYQGAEPESSRVETLVTYTAEARSEALGAAADFRHWEQSLEVALEPQTAESAVELARQRGMQRLLHFTGNGQIRVFLFVEEGTFSLETTRDELLKNLEEAQA